MNRRYDMQEAAKNNIYIHYGGFDCGVQDRCFDSFIDGAKWADEHVSNEVYEKVSNIIVDNAPDLEWNGCVRRTDQICAFSKTQFGTYSIIKHHFTCLFYWYFEDEILHGGALTLEECKLLANEDYKKRIKKALGVCE